MFVPMHLQIPSPVDALTDPLFDQKKIQVFVKRDDLIHPIISGNKWRKLKYLLQKASQNNQKTILTYGGAYSNHLLATAEACRLLGFNAVGIVRGEEQENHTLNYCRAAGMQLIFVTRSEYKDKESCLKHYVPKPDEHIVVLPEGGATPEGFAGCKEILAECAQKFDHIFCAAGTGTTAAGLYAYIKENDLKSTLNVVPVLKEGAFIRKEIERYLPTDEKVQVHTQYHGGGYGKTNSELVQFIVRFYQKHRILLDQVYTAKMMYGLYQLVEQDYFTPNSSILAIHTGGLYGLLSIGDKLSAIDPHFTQILRSLEPK